MLAGISDNMSPARALKEEIKDLSMYTPPTVSTNSRTIAGNLGGKRVQIVPAYEKTYDLLNKAAQAGNHWARLAVGGLQALSSGRLGKDNIYVRPNEMVARGKEEFFVILPGIKATVERQLSDTYKIVYLEFDTAYFEENDKNTMTGLYSASKEDDRWLVEFNENGELPSGNVGQRFVGISDRKYQNAESAAQLIAPLVSKAPGGGGPFFKKYDLHYTPGEKSIGGLKNYRKSANPLTNESVFGSAQMLAHSMLKAKNIEGVSWVSELGGSVVLTQAMKILSDQGVKLPGHSAFLYRPSSNVNEAVQYAHALGLNLDRNFVNTEIGDYMGNRDQVAMIRRRIKNEDAYSTGNAIWDFSGQATKVQGITAMATAALGAIGVGMAVPTFPILAAIGGALGGGVTALKAGDTLAKHVAPRYYEKHIGKIK